MTGAPAPCRRSSTCRIFEPACLALYRPRMPQKKDREKRVFTGVYFDRTQHDALRALSDRTRVPLAAYLREAVDMLLAKYKVESRKRRRR